MEGGGVHGGDDNHSNTGMTRRRVFGEMERDVDTTLVVQCDGLQLTYNVGIHAIISLMNIIKLSPAYISKSYRHT